MNDIRWMDEPKGKARPIASATATRLKPLTKQAGGRLYPLLRSFGRGVNSGKAKNKEEEEEEEQPRALLREAPCISIVTQSNEFKNSKIANT